MPMGRANSLSMVFASASGETGQLPLDAHEKPPVVRVHMLIQRHDIAAVPGDEARYRGHQPVSIRGMDQQDGGLRAGLRHGWPA